MMITIHGLPPRTNFQALKTLVKQQCNIVDFILDNLVDDGPNSKKVRIGLSDDTEGYRIMKCLDGFRMSPTHVLKIVPVGKQLNPPQQNFDQRPGFQNDYPNQTRPDYHNQPINDFANRGPQGPMDRHSGPSGPPVDNRYGPPGQRNMDHHGPGPRNPGQMTAPAPRQGSFQRPGPGHQGPNGPPDSRGPVNPGPPNTMHSEQWGPNVNPNNQWSQGGHMQSNNYNQGPMGPNQAGFGQQHPQGPEQYGPGRSMDHRYGSGFPPKPNEMEPPVQPGRRNALRMVDIVDTQVPARQDKPITIMKDNFLGPNNFNIGGQPQHGHFEKGQEGPAHWQQGQQSKPYDDRRHPPLDKRPDMVKQMDYDKRGQFSPLRNPRMSPGRRSPPRDGPLNTGRNYQEPGRRVSPSGRSFPPDRRVSPTSRLGPPVREFSPSGRRISPPGRRISPPGRRVSPSGRRISPPGRRLSPTGRRISPPGRKISPPGRRISPYGRRVSPPGRKVSPGRRVSPSGRRMSPPGRRISPSGKRISPSGRRMSPPGRKASPPGRRMSPGRRDEQRRMSPSMTYYNRADDRKIGRRESPRRYSPKRTSPGRPHRFSPSRLGDKLVDKFVEDKVPKPVRPAYEPPQAQNQSYSGGYRPSSHENAQYPVRQEPRISPWQTEKVAYPGNVKNDDDRHDLGRRGEKDISPRRQSRSPLRRDRSPLKDCFRRSPSFRSSRSPRRSWALEKRSPEPIREPPPPPVWPGQEAEEKRKPRFEEPKRAPVWERLDRSDEDRRAIEEKLRLRTESQAKFDRREFDERRDFRDDKQLDRDRDFHREARPDFPRRASPRREDKVFSEIDKDFQEIYKRAVEFRKKTEERKSGERRREEFDERRREDEPYRPESPPRRSRSRDRQWNVKDRKRIFLSPSVKAKREKAIDEISNKMLDKYEIRNEHVYRVAEEMKLTLANVFMDMYAEKDVSFIELVIKYNSRYDDKEEEKLMQDVLSRLPSQYRNLKRKPEGDSSKITAKTSRRSPPRNAREEDQRPKLSDAVIPDWSTGIGPPKLMGVNPVMGLTNPVVVNPSLYVPSLQAHVIPQQQMFQQQSHFGGGSMPQPIPNPMSQQMPQMSEQMSQQISQQMPQMSRQMPQVSQQMPQMSQQMPQMSQQMAQMSQQIPQMSQQMSHMSQQMPQMSQQQQQPKFEPAQDSLNEYYNLYLCQDDFEPFTKIQAEYLKDFLVSQIVRVTETSNGWAPDITLKGLQSMYRYEVTTKDERSKDWLVNLNFSEFEYFNVLVYTKEELWYERAAIWLPGHSRGRNIEPLEKLKMQNKRLEGVNMDRWKFVKKIVTGKGTRLYVDMPPSSARALEKHKMLLSYELQKVSVFLKAVAVDKETFDSGLKFASISDPSLLISAVQNSPMPTLGSNEPGLIKIGMNGQKSLTLEQARKIKEVVVYFLFKYHQNDGSGRTDFVKYGFCPPTYLGIVPENAESKRWLMSRNFGKMNRHTIVVVNDDDVNTKYFKMIAYIPHEYHQSHTLALERLKQSNQGMKNLHFNLWKPLKMSNERKRAVLEVDIDLESVEALSRLKFKLDYVGEYGIQTVNFKSEYSMSKLEEKIKKFKMEQVDSYVVANMDIDSDKEDSDKDVVFVG